MDYISFTEHELSVLSNALRVAAERFEEYSKAPALVPELQEVFKTQAIKTRALYSRIEEETGYAC